MDKLDHLVKRIGWYTKKVSQLGSWPKQKRDRRRPRLLAYKERLHDLIEKEKMPSAPRFAEGEPER